jgi:UDP-GlcNAc:undecaprenyl-phosphate GlcNAc-1-phosphate transferase
VFSFVRRLWRRQRWHQADAGHLHHRLMNLGHGPRRTVAMLWAWTALLSAVALVPTYTKEGNAVVPFVAAGLALLLFAVFHPGLRGARLKMEKAAHPAGPPASDGVVDLDQRRRQRA